MTPSYFRDGAPKRNLDLDTESKRQRYGYLDPYVNVTGRPPVPRVYNWTYLSSDSWYHHGASRQKDFPFRLSLNTVSQSLGTLQGVQVRFKTYPKLSLSTDSSLRINPPLLR